MGKFVISLYTLFQNFQNFYRKVNFMTDKIEYEVSSGNIFADMGLANSEERLAKAKLASKIIEISKERRLTQKKMVAFLGIDQPKISALYNGRLSGFSIDYLIKFLMILDQDIEITIKEKSNRHQPLGHLSVMTRACPHKHFII